MFCISDHTKKLNVSKKSAFSDNLIEMLIDLELWLLLTYYLFNSNKSKFLLLAMALAYIEEKKV